MYIRTYVCIYIKHLGPKNLYRSMYSVRICLNRAVGDGEAGDAMASLFFGNLV